MVVCHRTLLTLAFPVGERRWLQCCFSAAPARIRIFAAVPGAGTGTTRTQGPNGSTAQFQALQLWRCHGYASNGISQRWTFLFVASNSLGPTYRIANIGGSNYCLGLDVRMTLTTAYAQWAGKNLVQEACSDTTGSEVVWNLVPATQSPDPSNQFMITSTDMPFNQQPYCVAANTFLDTNGNRLIAEPCDPYNSSQWFALG